MFLPRSAFDIRRPRRRGPLPLPLYLSRVPAGFPSPGDDFADATLDLNDLVEHPAATFFVRVSGQSMQNAGIHDGDLLIVDRSRTARNGSIVIAVTNGEMTVKKLERRQARWWLVPANAEFQPIAVSENTELWGIVAHVIKSYR